MKRADKLYREMVLSGRSMGRRRRLPCWVEAAACWVALGAMVALLGWAFCRALDSEAALWHVGEYGRVAPVEEVDHGLE